MEQVTLAEAQARLADLFAAVEQGETVYIIGGDHQVLQLVPVGATMPPRVLGFQSAYSELRYFGDPHPVTPKQAPQFGNAAGTGWMADDFDAPLDEFAEYM